MHTTGAGESHEVDSLACALRIGERTHDFGIFEDALVGDRAVDFHEVLVEHATGADVEVSHFRVTHLSVGQSHILTTRLELRIWICFQQIVPVGGWSFKDDVALGVVANAPAIENHQ